MIAETWRIEYSTNLLQWSELLRTNLSGVPVEITDSTGAAAALRFYRAVKLP